MAFALIWADGTAPVQTDNEAYARASCEGCTAVAVAFQVVLVVGEGAPLAPANIAVAASADCTSCLTWSTAVQLFVTLDGPLGADATARLEELWREVMAYAADIGSRPLDEIQAELTAFEERVLAIIEEDQGPLGTTTSATPTASGSGSPAATGSASTTASPSGYPSASTPASGSATPSASPSASSSASSSTSPSGSTTPSSSPSPTSTPTSGTPSSSG